MSAIRDTSISNGHDGSNGMNAANGYSGQSRRVGEDAARVNGFRSPTTLRPPVHKDSNYGLAVSKETQVDERRPSSSYRANTTDTIPKPNLISGIGNNGLADFFSTEVFQIVLHNPTTAHRLLKFSQKRLCGEQMEFLEKVDRYNALLDELTTTMSDIHRLYTAPDAPKQLNISSGMTKQINADIRASTASTLPLMELIFAEAQEHVERTLATEVYPRFVRYQMTTSATRALSTNRGKYQGLGDCFCLTNPAKADNPIVFASDGFIGVTGYSRSEIIPRNCRFLQGNYTDKAATRRLKASIDSNEETVELLLNYRKNGEPFWNLLYVAPLLNAEGKPVYFLGGQINCSTTIRSCSDVLRVLSASDDGDEDDGASLMLSQETRPPRKRNFFKPFRREDTAKAAEVRDTGMEQGLLNRIEKMNFKSQVQNFYTAYSKYLVVNYEDFCIQFYSPGVLNVLSITTRTSANFVGSDVFRFLSQHTAILSKDFKAKVRDSLKQGQAVSLSINLFTLRSLARKSDDKFLTHWTPLKDEQGKVKMVILTLSSTTYE